MSKKNKILITGGLGYVGGRLCLALSANYDIILSSRHNISKEILDIHKAIKAVKHKDLLSLETFPDDLFAIIHLASLNENDSEKKIQDAISINIGDTVQIAELAIQKKVSKFIYLSTVHVYGSPLQGQITESSTCNAIHPYAVTHKSAEELLQYVFDKAFFSSLTILRLSNSFGPPILPTVNRWSLIFNNLCKDAITKKEIQVLSKLNQVRDYITLSDVCKKVHQLLDKDSYQIKIYNLSSGKSQSLVNVADIIQQAYFHLFSMKLNVIFPKDFEINSAGPLTIINKSLVEDTGDLDNNFIEETTNLLLFCEKHFGKA